MSSILEGKPMFFRRGPFLLAGTLVAAFFSPAVAASQSGDPILGPGDVLKIEVYDEKELSLEVVVSASGTFSYPLLDLVDVSGHTAHSLARHMEHRLFNERYLRFPSVNVIVTSHRNSVVTLSGAVKEPGTYSLIPGTRLREFLADHGGVMSDNAGPTIVLQRARGPSLRIRREDVYSGDILTRAKNNPTLYPGDEVIVPESGVFYVTGAVTIPAEYQIDREITVRDAIAAAGGWTKDAGETVFWQRKNADGAGETILFNRDLLSTQNEQVLQLVGPGDTIYIPKAETFFVGGEVKAAGEFPWESGVTLTKAVTLAGDVDEYGGSNASIIRETKDGERTITKYNLNSIKRGRKDDPAIQPGDIITVGGGLLKLPSKLRKALPISIPLFLFE